MQVQADHVDGLGFKVRVVRREMAFELMRLDVMLGQGTCHRHVRDAAAQLGCELARVPMGGIECRLVLGRASQHAGLKTIRYLVSFAPRMPSEQAGQAIRREAFVPVVDVAVAAIELGANLGPSQAIGQQRDTERRPLRPSSRARRSAWAHLKYLAYCADGGLKSQDVRSLEASN